MISAKGHNKAQSHNFIFIDTYILKKIINDAQSTDVGWDNNDVSTKNHIYSAMTMLSQNQKLNRPGPG